MPAAIGAFPSLSELLTWPTEHLAEGADYWTATANRWSEVFTQIWQDSLTVDWKGNAAEALQTRTYADMTKVNGVVDQLNEAAKVARTGASDLTAARSRVRYRVEDVRNAGFDVGEDLSVADRSSGGLPATRAARQAQARTFAGDISQRAIQLVGLDQQVAGRITTATAGIGNITFDEPPIVRGTALSSFGEPLSTFAPAPQVILTWCDKFLDSFLCHDYYPDGSRHDYRYGWDRSGVWP